MDADIPDTKIAAWSASLPAMRIALTCAEVRAVFVGKPLARAMALVKLRRAQVVTLFPGGSQQKGA
ncbi:MAG: hypothetical protein R3B70_11505 [Polyangiaceae bacterium]